MKKKLYGSLLAVGLLLGTSSVVTAQQKAGPMPPPKVLLINREVLKPGKSGLAHQKSERAFVEAMNAAHSPDHYIALDSLTGVSRSLFLTGYDSFAQWEEHENALGKDASVTAALDRAAEADGDLLSSYESSMYVLREDQSYNTGGGLAHARFFEISAYRVKQGHDADWDALVKLVKDALIKTNPDDSWAMYERAYGAAVPVFVVMRAMKSASEIDRSFANSPKFMAAMGDDGMKKLGELSAAAIEGAESNLFIINPRISYVGPELINADPDFWKTAKAVPDARRGSVMERPAQ